MRVNIITRPDRTMAGYWVGPDLNGNWQFMNHDREDGSPSVQCNDGGYFYYSHGKGHKLNGAAYWNFDLNYYAFHVNDKDVTKETKKWLKENNIDHLNMSSEEEVLLTLFLSGFM